MIKSNEYIITTDTGEKIHALVPEEYTLFGQMTACIQVATTCSKDPWDQIKNIEFVGKMNCEEEMDPIINSYTESEEL